MPIETVATSGAPRAIGPYSQALRAGGFLFTAGQVGFDPATGELVDGGIGEQTRQVLQNIRAILEAGGSGLAQVVKTHRPARSTVAVAALPRGARVEIEAVAAI